MTYEQRERINTMRKNEIGYKKIAQVLGLSESTVKSYCRRHVSLITEVETTRCVECRKLLDISKRKNRRFCSDSCRMKWWNKHPKSEMPYTAICAYCCKEIPMRRKNERKYCSQHCYIAARYMNGSKHD